MSLALMKLSSSSLMIAGDSRMSLSSGGLDYACGHARKIEQIGNTVLFTSGHAVVGTRIRESFRMSSIHNIHTLKDISKYELDKFIEETKDYEFGKDYNVKEKLITDVTWCCFENNIPVIYNIDSRKNYNIIREVCDYDETAFAAVGMYVEEAVAIAKRLDGRMHPLEIYREVYSQLADEKVGGNLDVYTFTNGKVIHSLQCPIVERKPVRHFDQQYQMNNTDGFYIDKNTGSGEMERVFWLDTDGNINARSGHFRDSLITDGSIEGATMRIGSGNHVFKADYNGIYLGSEIFANAPFRVGLDGILYANAAHLKDSFITDGELVGGSLTIGSGDSVLHVNNQGIYLGSDDPNSAPFWVNPKGRATMSDLVIKGSDGRTMLETNGNKIWLNNMDLEGVGRLLAEMLEVNTILADDGYVNNLTVNRLKTIGKDAEVGEYIDYIDIQDNRTRYITAQVASKEQAKDSRNRLLYWQDSEKRILTTEDTGIIAYSYGLPEENMKIKREITFDGSGDAAQPVEKIGTGDGGANDRARMVNTKYNGGYKQEYKASNNGRIRSIDFKDSGIYVNSENEVIGFTSKDHNVVADGGAIKLALSNGSNFELSQSGLKLDVKGNIDIKATGTVKINGTRIDLN